LSFAEREEIAMLKSQDTGVREIARRLNRHPSTVGLPVPTVGQPTDDLT
jgi:IS30 family transposase